MYVYAVLSALCLVLSGVSSCVYHTVTLPQYVGTSIVHPLLVACVLYTAFYCNLVCVWCINLLYYANVAGG